MLRAAALSFLLGITWNAPYAAGTKPPAQAMDECPPKPLVQEKRLRTVIPIACGTLDEPDPFRAPWPLLDRTAGSLRPVLRLTKPLTVNLIRARPELTREAARTKYGRK